MKDQNPPDGKAETPVVTVGQRLDSKIQGARQRLHDLCVAKAKAEALGMLDYSQEFIDSLAYGPF